MHTYHNYKNSDEDNRFKTISEFEDCMIRGAEVLFSWNGITYTITHTADSISIMQSYCQETEILRETADEILEYMVGSDRLRDVITKVHVIVRTL